MRIQASSAGSIPITGTVLDIGRVSRSSLVHSLRGMGWDPEAGREAGRDAGGGPPLAATGDTGSWVRLAAVESLERTSRHAASAIAAVSYTHLTLPTIYSV